MPFLLYSVGRVRALFSWRSHVCLFLTCVGFVFFLFVFNYVFNYVVRLGLRGQCIFEASHIPPELARSAKTIGICQASLGTFNRLLRPSWPLYFCHWHAAWKARPPEKQGQRPSCGKRRHAFLWHRHIINCLARKIINSFHGN